MCRSSASDQPLQWFLFMRRPPVRVAVGMTERGADGPGALAVVDGRYRPGIRTGVTLWAFPNDPARPAAGSHVLCIELRRNSGLRRSAGKLGIRSVMDSLRAGWPTAPRTGLEPNARQVSPPPCAVGELSPGRTLETCADFLDDGQLGGSIAGHPGTPRPLALESARPRHAGRFLSRGRGGAAWSRPECRCA
jgi:hypothetical protein